MAVTTLALTVGGLTSALADTITSPNAKTGTETNATQPDPSKPGAKTSDRTPGDPAPQRTPNATDEGAAGTDAGQTQEGTSDRTPSKQELHLATKSLSTPKSGAGLLSPAFFRSIEPHVAAVLEVWQSSVVRKRLFKRWFVGLGMLAMLGALISMPMTSTYAFAMAGAKTAATASMDGMPCHKLVKHCPDCPQKVCPDIGTCLVKCFQPLSPPVAEASLQGDVVSARVAPEPSQIRATSLIPPLLRPPSV